MLAPIQPVNYSICNFGIVAMIRKWTLSDAPHEKIYQKERPLTAKTTWYRACAWSRGTEHAHGPRKH